MQTTFLSENHVGQYDVSSLKFETSNGVIGNVLNGDLRFGEDDETVFSIDWLSLTLWMGFSEVVRAVSSLGFVNPEHLNHGGRGFRDCWILEGGLKVYSTPARSGGSSSDDYCLLDWSGSACSNLSLSDLVQFFDVILDHEIKWNCTRLDLALDTRQFEVQQVADAREAGSIDTRARSWSEIKSFDGNHDGHTVYIGSRSKTSTLARIYKKRVKSHQQGWHVWGGDPFTRVELVLRRERASMALSMLIAWDISDWAVLSASLLRGFVDFKCDWWRDWLSGVRKSAIHIKTASKPSVSKTRDYLHSKIAPMLAMYIKACTKLLANHDEREYMKYALLDELLADGGDRLGMKHHRLIRLYEPEADETAPLYVRFAGRGVQVGKRLLNDIAF